jgi:hypothetical protein
MPKLRESGFQKSKMYPKPKIKESGFQKSKMYSMSEIRESGFRNARRRRHGPTGKSAQ